MAGTRARSRARQLWDSAESDGLGLGLSLDGLRLDDVTVGDEQDARPLGLATATSGQESHTLPSAHLARPAPGGARQASAASRLAAERRRLRELESARRKTHVGRRKERRGLNVALLGHGLGALQEDDTGEEEDRTLSQSGVGLNPWRSTFPVPLPVPVLRLLSDHWGTPASPPKRASSAQKRGRGPHAMALSRATAILSSAGLLLSDLPPTREMWRLAPQAARAWAVPQPGRQRQPTPTALVGLGLGAEEREGLHAMPQAEVSDYGPLQMGVIQMALDISRWADMLDARGRRAPPPAHTVGLESEEDADPDATVQAPASPPADLPSLCCVRDEASAYTEVLRSSTYLIWHVPDPFGRLLVHAVARVYDCGSFSAEVPGLVAGEQAPTRCTFITHPHRRLPRRQEIVSCARQGFHASSSPVRRHAGRRRAPSAASAASSARLTTTSAAQASSRSRSPGTSVTSAASVLSASASEDEWWWEDEDGREEGGQPAHARPPRVRQLTGHLTESDASGVESLSASEVEEV